MKVTLKIGKKSETVKIKTTTELGNFVHVLYGEILKHEVTPELVNDFSCKLDGEKIEPKKLLLILKDTLKNANSKKEESSKKKDKKSKVSKKKKKDKSISDKKSEKKKSKKKSDSDKKNVKEKKKNKKSKDSKKKSKKKKSLDLLKSSENQNGLVRLHRRKLEDDE